MLNSLILLFLFLIIIIYSKKSADNLKFYLIAFLTLDTLRLIVKSTKFIQEYGLLNNFMDLFGLLSFFVIIHHFSGKRYSWGNARTLTYLFLFALSQILPWIPAETLPNHLVLKEL